jgi:hypothetical protein
MKSIRHGYGFGLLNLTIVLFVTGLCVVPAHAYPVHRRLFRVVYKKPVRCTLCHSAAGGTERNGYASAWEDKGASLEAFQRIEELDSDSDGATNIEEIRGGSNPGDARSTIQDPGRKWRRAEKIPIPIEQLKLVFDRADSVEALEPELSRVQISKIERQSGAAMSQEDRHPTLYLSVRNGSRVAVASFSQFRFRNQPYALLFSVGSDGKFQKAAIFNAGERSVHTYLPFLKCLRGHGKRDLPNPGQAGCPSSRGHDLWLRGLAQALRVSMWTMATVFESMKATPSPPASASAMRQPPVASPSSTLEPLPRPPRRPSSGAKEPGCSGCILPRTAGSSSHYFSPMILAICWLFRRRANRMLRH